jgi:hypothetical protein
MLRRLRDGLAPSSQRRDGRLRAILTDNGSEFRNGEFTATVIPSALLTG